MCGEYPCPVSRNSCGWRLAPIQPHSNYVDIVKPPTNGHPSTRQGHSRPTQGYGRPVQGYRELYGRTYAYGRK